MGCGRGIPSGRGSDPIPRTGAGGGAAALVADEALPFGALRHGGHHARGRRWGDREAEREDLPPAGDGGAKPPPLTGYGGTAGDRGEPGAAGVGADDARRPGDRCGVGVGGVLAWCGHDPRRTASAFPGAGRRSERSGTRSGGRRRGIAPGPSLAGDGSRDRRCGLGRLPRSSGRGAFRGLVGPARRRRGTCARGGGPRTEHRAHRPERRTPGHRCALRPGRPARLAALLDRGRWEPRPGAGGASAAARPHPRRLGADHAVLPPARPPGRPVCLGRRRVAPRTRGRPARDLGGTGPSNGTPCPDRARGGIRPGGQ